MNYIPPIPTTYKGITYRSKLEARYAVFFEQYKDFLVEYEPKIHGVKGYIYTPDFMLHSPTFITNNGSFDRCFIEIEPNEASESYLNYVNQFFDSDWHKQSLLLIFSGKPSLSQPDGYIIQEGKITKGFEIVFNADGEVYILQTPISYIVESLLRRNHGSQAKEFYVKIWQEMQLSNKFYKRIDIYHYLPIVYKKFNDKAEQIANNYRFDLKTCVE